MPNGTEFPKFPTAITEADRERIVQLEEQRRAMAAAYKTKFSKEAWAGVPAAEKIARRVAPSAWLTKPIEALPGTAETLEFGFTPEQFAQKSKEVEAEFKELTRRQRVTGLLPNIQADLSLAALRGEPITDVSDLLSTFPELREDFTDEEIGYLMRMSQALTTASPEQIMSGELFPGGAGQLPVSREDYDAIFKSGIHDPTQAYAVIEFAKDFEGVTEALRQAYPSRVPEDEQEEEVRKRLEEYFRNREVELGIVPEGATKEAVKKAHEGIAADAGKSLTLVNETGTMYPSRVKADNTVWIGDELAGSYNAETGEVVPINMLTGEVLKTEAQRESYLKDMWDSFYLGMRQAWHGTRQGLSGVLPRELLKTTVTAKGETEFTKGLRAWAAKATAIVKENQDLREAEHQEWLKEHPELAPRPEYTQSPLENKELFQDPAWYAHIILSNAPIIGSALVTGLVTTFATKNPLAGAVAGAAVLTPMQINEVYEDLVANGADPNNATSIATGVGTLIGAIEIIPGMIALKAIAPAFMGAFGSNLRKEAAKQVVKRLSARGILATASKIEVAETTEEVLQSVLQNAAVKTINEDRSLVEDIPRTAIETMVAVFPLALFGGGAQYVSMKRNLPPKVQEELDTITAKMEEAGLAPDHAEAVALSKILETETGQAQVEEAIAKSKEEIPITPEKITKAEEDIDSYTEELDTLTKSLETQEARIVKTIQPYEKVEQQATIQSLKDEIAEVTKEKELAQTKLKKTRKKAEKVVAAPEEILATVPKTEYFKTSNGSMNILQVDTGTIEFDKVSVGTKERQEGKGKALVLETLEHIRNTRPNIRVVKALAAGEGTKTFWEKVGFSLFKTHHIEGKEAGVEEAPLKDLPVFEMRYEIVPKTVPREIIPPVSGITKEFNLEGKDSVTTYAKDGIIKSINGVNVTPEQYEAHGEDLMDYLELNFTVESTTKNEQLGGWKTVFKKKAVPTDPDILGKQIAETLGVRYDGVQEGIGMQFTDLQTGSTTYGNTLEEARTNIENMRAKFAVPEATVPLAPEEWIPEFIPTEPGRMPDARPRLRDYEDEELAVKKALDENKVIADKLIIPKRLAAARDVAETRLNMLQDEYVLAKETGIDETIKATEAKIKAMAKEAGLPRKALLGKRWDNLLPNQQADLTLSMIEDGSLVLPTAFEYGDIKHYVRFLEEETGLPFYQLYPRVRKDFGASQREGEKVLKRLRLDPKLKDVVKSKESQVRVTQAINSANPLLNVPAIEDLTESEERLRDTVEDILKHYEPYIRYLRVMGTDSTLEAFKEEFLDAVEANKEYELQVAIALKERGDFDSLWMQVNSVSWGTVTGYTPWMKSRASIFPRQIKLGTVRGESRLMQRDSVEFDESIGETLLLDVVRYVKQIEAQWRLRPDLESYDVMWKKASKKFKGYKRIEARLKSWGSEMQGMPPSEGSAGIDLINRIWRQAMSAVFLHPRLAGRNIHQGIAFHPDRIELLRLFKQAYPPALKEKANIYYENFVHQLGGIRTDFLLSEGQGLWGLNWLNKWADSWSMYAQSDNIPRMYSFLGSANKAWRATEAYLTSTKTAKDLNVWIRKSGALHLTETERNYALQLLAQAEESNNLAVPGLESVTGAEEVSFYIGHEMADITHFIYSRAFRAPVEMGTSGRLVFNLIVFPRGYAQRVLLQSKKVGGVFHKDTNWAEAAAGFKDVLLLTVVGSMMSSWISFLFGWKRRAYDPMNIVQWQLGGLALGVGMDMGEFVASIFTAFNMSLPKEDRDVAFAKIAPLLERNTLTMVPFYKNFLDAIESSLGKEELGVNTAYRQLRGLLDDNYTAPEIEEMERDLWEKLRHAVFASDPLDPTDFEKARSQIEDAEVRLGEYDISGRLYDIGDYGSQVAASTKNLPDYALVDSSGFSPRSMFYFQCADMWEELYKLPSAEKEAWRKEHILEEAMLIFWQKYTGSVFIRGSAEHKEVTRILSTWINQYEIDYTMHGNPKVRDLIARIRGLPEEFPAIPLK